MAPKIEAVRRRFAQTRLQLCCPLCRGRLALRQNSLVCPQGHCYDLSAQNYLNLAPHKPQAENKYSAGLFAARRRVFEAGFYDPLLEQLLERLLAYARRSPAAPLQLLDAGCGEGFFAARLLERLRAGRIEAELCALDLSRDGIRLAAQHREPGLCCLIGDLARLPLADHSLDIVLNILSPASYGEFARVLRPGGLLLKVIPGGDYLREVRSALGVAPRPAAEQEQAVRLWRQNLGGGQVESLIYRRGLTPEQAADFLQMSPLTFGCRPESLPAQGGFRQVTIDLQILSATVK